MGALTKKAAKNSGSKNFLAIPFLRHAAHQHLDHSMPSWATRRHHLNPKQLKPRRLPPKQQPRFKRRITFNCRRLVTISSRACSKNSKTNLFKKGQVVVLSRWVNQYKMTSQQVATILKLQRFRSDRLEVLQLLAGCIRYRKYQFGPRCHHGFERNAGRPKRKFFSSGTRKKVKRFASTSDTSRRLVLKVQNQKNIH